jgi:hypothetical protein
MIGLSVRTRTSWAVQSLQAASFHRVTPVPAALAKGGTGVGLCCLNETGGGAKLEGGANQALSSST